MIMQGVFKKSMENVYHEKIHKDFKDVCIQINSSFKSISPKVSWVCSGKTGTSLCHLPTHGPESQCNHNEGTKPTPPNQRLIYKVPDLLGSM